MEAGSLKGETSCFHKSRWTLRGLKGYVVQEWGGGVPLWWYGSLMGTADNTLPPTSGLQACPAFYNPLCSGQQAEIETGGKAGRETVLISHLLIFEAISEFSHIYHIPLPSAFIFLYFRLYRNADTIR